MVGFKQRGLRNNNPFNIRKSNNDWVGKTYFAKGDKDFEQFSCMYYGLRAGMKLLVNYVNKGIDTPRKIIERFAPSTENNTDAYLHFVIRNSRGLAFIQSDEHIGDIHTLCVMASRMLKYENSLTPTMQENLCMTPAKLEELCNFYKLELK